MWKQSAQEFEHSFNTAGKCCPDSTSQDSGFLSNGHSINYSSSSEYYLNSISQANQPVAFESMKDMESGIECSLIDSLNQFSLKQVSLNPFNSNTMFLKPTFELELNNIDSGKSSTTIDLEEPKDYQEPWQLYFTQNEDGNTLLHNAIIHSYFEASLSLINMAPHSYLFDIINDDGQTALHVAVITSQPKIIRKLVLSEADLSIRNYQGNTALHLACIFGDLACVKALTEPISMYEQNLLSRKLPTVPQNLEQKNYNGETCLHVAASKGHVGVVEQLLRRGADLEARESLGGRTALHLALENSRPGVVLYVARECRPRLDAPTYSGYTAHQVATYIDERLARELVRLGATPTGESPASRA